VWPQRFSDPGRSDLLRTLTSASLHLWCRAYRAASNEDMGGGQEARRAAGGSCAEAAATRHPTCGRVGPQAPYSGGRGRKPSQLASSPVRPSSGGASGRDPNWMENDADCVGVGGMKWLPIQRLPVLFCGKSMTRTLTLGDMR